MSSGQAEAMLCTLPLGPSRTNAEILGELITLFTYRPIKQESARILLLFDGMTRNAAGIRDKAVPLCERRGIIAIAPLMDRERFPKWRYDWAGVVRDKVVQSRQHWLGTWLQALVEWARDLLGGTKPQLYLFGHSAGGQLLSRMSAYTPPLGVSRIVVSNSSAYVLPLLRRRAPYGFWGVFDSDDAVKALEAYLTLPITIYLGQEDTGDFNLSKQKGAIRQGKNRLERGRRVYEFAERAAQARGFTLNWRLVEVPGAGHSSRDMLNAEQIEMALDLEERMPTAESCILSSVGT